jgi:hypothetical protein
MYEMKFILQPEPCKARANCIKAIQEAPDRYEVEIYRPRKEKTPSQNATLFGVAYPVIMDALGYSGNAEKEFLHEAFCGDFFGWKLTEIMGKTKRRPVRTTTTNEFGKRDLISTIEMARFYEFVQRQAAEYGVIVPDPAPNDMPK